jgi:hypothetical protein
MSSKRDRNDEGRTGKGFSEVEKQYIVKGGPMKGDVNAHKRGYENDKSGRQCKTVADTYDRGLDELP